MKQIALVVMAAIAGLFLAFFTLAATLPPVTLAITLVLIVLFGLIVGAPMFWLLARLTRATEIRPPAEPQVIGYSPASSWARPQPRLIDVPRFELMGQARPLGLLPREPDALRTTTKTGETITVPLHLAVRFAECPTPARGEWTGKREHYTAAGAFFHAHGMTDRDNRGGWRWRDEYGDPADRVAFVRQFTHDVGLVDAESAQPVAATAR